MCEPGGISPETWSTTYKALAEYDGIYFTNGNIYGAAAGYDLTLEQPVSNSIGYQFVDDHNVHWYYFYYNTGDGFFLLAKQFLGYNAEGGYLCSRFVDPSPAYLKNTYSVYGVNGIGFYTIAYLNTNSTLDARGRVTRTEWFTWNDDFTFSNNVATDFDVNSGSAVTISYFNYTKGTIAEAEALGWVMP